MLFYSKESHICINSLEVQFRETDCVCTHHWCPKKTSNFPFRRSLNKWWLWWPRKDPIAAMSTGCFGELPLCSELLFPLLTSYAVNGTIVISLLSSFSHSSYSSISPLCLTFRSYLVQVNSLQQHAKAVLYKDQFWCLSMISLNKSFECFFFNCWIFLRLKSIAVWRLWLTNVLT